MITAEIYDEDEQYAPASRVKVGEHTYIREDLVDKKLAEVAHSANNIAIEELEKVREFLIADSSNAFELHFANMVCEKFIKKQLNKLRNNN